jgi:hypothetical protein
MNLLINFLKLLNKINFNKIIISILLFYNTNLFSYFNYLTKTNLLFKLTNKINNG